MKYADINGHSVAIAPQSAGWQPLSKPVLVTGGAGFIGSNVANALLSSGQPVLVLDNLSRPGVDRNLRWLQEQHGDLIEPIIGDIRDVRLVRDTVARAAGVFHFAAQVAVTTSLVDPAADFSINANGTFNVLEAIRSQATPPPLLFTSTNKVYGGLEDVILREADTCYEPDSGAYRTAGVSEARCLDFHSPYGCSKGTADQYVIDYARSYGLKTVVFRMSCIYGQRQFGTEEQGWVAHFLIQALKGNPITIYGDGKQVRDILHIDDLVPAMLLAVRNIDRVSGQAFNIGGGPRNTISLLDLLNMIERLHGDRPVTTREGWRVGDQRYYVSDTSKFHSVLDWYPHTDACKGITKLYNWLLDNDVATARPTPEAERALAATGAG